MKKTGRVLSLILALLMVLGAMAGCGSPAATPEGPKSPDASNPPPSGAKSKFVIYAWNEEFKNMMTNYYNKDKGITTNSDGTFTTKDGVTIEFVINPNDEGVYQQKLDQALQNGEQIDMFLIEADYAKKYVNSDYTLPLSEVGITDDMLTKNQYQYTIDVAKSEDGVVKGTSWQAAPGLFMYRRSLAEKYLGASEPDKVQPFVKDWDTFLGTARKVNQASGGATKMICSIEDLWQVIRTDRKSPWVVNDKFVVDKQVGWYMDYAKKMIDENLVLNAVPWSEGWNGGVGNDTVFGYFFSTWGIQWTMVGNSGGTKPGEGTYGDWAAIPGPQPYYWGGTWLTAATTCTNKALAKDIMEYFTINVDSMKKYCVGDGTETFPGSKDYVNNKTSIQQIIDSGYSFDFLGGQDHYSLFQQAASKIDTSAMTGYDQNINIFLNQQVQSYVRGEKDKNAAVGDLKKQVVDMFPELTAE